MPHYIALIRKERDSIYGVSFPDVPGVIAAADTLDTTLSEARGGARLRGRGLGGEFQRSLPSSPQPRCPARRPAVPGNREGCARRSGPVGDDGRTCAVTHMRSTIISVRIDAGIKARLEKLAESTGRSCSSLAAEAIDEYLDVNDWQIAGIKRAIASLERGEGIPPSAGQGLDRILGH